MIAKLRRLNYRHVLPDLVLVAASFYLSLFLRVGADDFHRHLLVLNKHIALFLALRIGTFVVLGVYDIIWRYISLKDAVKLGRGVALSTLLVIAATYVVDIGRVPRATFFIDGILAFMLLCGIRFARRLVAEYSPERGLVLTGRKALVVGAGMNGRNLVSRLQCDSDVGLRLVGFVDDAPGKVNRLIAGTRVLGTVAQLKSLIESFGITEVIVSISEPSSDLMRHVVKICRQTNVTPRLMSSLQREASKTRLVRNVELSDLLNRPPKNVDFDSISHLIDGRSVLVTGAGGTIGSELARQVLKFNPEQILLLDHSEFNLYQIDNELRVNGLGHIPVVSLMMDIKSPQSLKHVFEKYRPTVVLHAAAYKHVHLVENNPYPAILNNVAGTRNLIDLSLEHNVETFVLISTDKAVNPVGIMGATKRACELMIAQVGRETGKRYCAVRFGNVLGSSGSLIPLLKRQIQEGLPITITHPDMTRYFMLVEEAVSLVLKAAAISAPGDIAILDMGNPVRILDVAKGLYALMGNSSDEPNIIFTGLRPGEKLFEELYICGNEIKTESSDIFILPRGDGQTEQLLGQLDSRIGAILQMAAQFRPVCVELLKALVVESNRPTPVAESNVVELVKTPRAAGAEPPTKYPN